MEVVIDPHVRAVAEFMQRHVPPAKRMGVANRLVEIADLLWGHYEPEDVSGLRRAADPRSLNILPHSEISPLSASGHGLGPACADDGSAVAAGAL
jgi:hypothetical protein